jgi:hypothetical protein
VKHLRLARSFHVDEDLALSETPTASASINRARVNFASEDRPGRSGFDEGVLEAQVQAGVRAGMSDGFQTRAGEMALARSSGELGH